MDYSRVIPFILLFGSVAFSQTPGKQFSSETLRANCPVELRATLWLAGKTVPIVPVENARTEGSDRRLQITLSNPKFEIVVAKITIHGFPVGDRVEPAVLYSPNDPNEIRKTIIFDRTVALEHAASIDTSVEDFSTVTSIDLNQVTYSDGSGWHPENSKYCRAVGLPIDAAANTLSH